MVHGMLHGVWETFRKAVWGQGAGGLASVSGSNLRVEGEKGDELGSSGGSLLPQKWAQVGLGLPSVSP